MVFFDKDTVKAISCNSDLEALVNEQHIIIRGQQSCVDNSWHTDLNITREKTSIQENNFVTPIISPRLYNGNNNKILACTQNEPKVTRVLVYNPDRRFQSN